MSSKVIQKYTETMQKIQEVILNKLVIEESDFTGKIMIEINCNQGGISNAEVYTVRKIK